MAFWLLFFLVLLIGLSMELKLSKLIRIGYAINDKLRAILEKKAEENVQRPTPNVQRPMEEKPLSPARPEEPPVYKL